MSVLKGGVLAWKKAGYPLIERGPVSSLFGRILVPLDGSEASEAVLYQAERLLCGRKGEVILFHSWDSAGAESGTAEEAEDYLKRIEERLTSIGAPVVRRLVARGPVGQSLPDAIRRENVSLVAMSSHGRETSPGEPVAATVEELLKGSRVPIFVARSFRPGASGEVVPSECEAPTIRRILVPLDGSSYSEAVLPYAKELGHLLGSRIIILHVAQDGSDVPGKFWGPLPPGESLGPPPGEDARPADRIEYMARTFAAAGLDTMTLHLAGDPITSILDFARPSAADLIAMTTHGQSGLAKILFGSIAERVLREAVLPTLVVRSDSPAAPQVEGV